jgi:hypothetical protein
VRAVGAADLGFETGDHATDSIAATKSSRRLGST